jgi:hypothetical protein
VVSEFPDVGYHQPALNRIAVCEKKISEETLPAKDGADAPAIEPSLVLPENG